MGPGKKIKKNSKRIGTKLRVKIDKKVREHKKKLKKDMKNNPDKYKKSKKDPGVPNECPFKNKVIAEARQVMAQRAEVKEKKRIELKELKKQAKQNKQKLLNNLSLEGLVAKAQHKTAMFDKSQGIKESAQERGLTDKSAKAYYKEFRKVIEAADVVLEVLDARDPMGSRCKEVEEAVMSGSKAGKRLVLVLNKADLVPRENLLAWMKYLRNEYPTIPFKASTQQSGRLGQAKINMKDVDVQIKTSKCVGADILLSLLGNYCRNKDIKTAIKVGVVGMPNVGKSSLINSLKRARACTVGATPGVTKSMQEVQLDKKVTLLDCPGLVMAGGNKTDASVALRNAIKVESLMDPVTPVIAILARVPRQHLMLKYQLSNFNDAAEFLALLAIRMGKLLRSGVPDRTIAARKILQDWNTGKIKYFTHPPEQNSSEAYLGAEIVQQFATEFALEELDSQINLNHLPKLKPSDIVEVPSSMMVETAEEFKEEKEEEMEESDSEEEQENDENILPENIEIFVKDSGKKKKAQKNEAEKDDDADEPLYKLEGNQRMKKNQKLQKKKLKRSRQRADKLGDELTDQMESAFSGLQSEAYDFKTDFTD